MIRAVLFDLDGTLLDTAPDMGAALNALLQEESLPALPLPTIRPWVSHGAAALVRLGFGEPEAARFETLRQRFLALYARDVARATTPFAGALPVLDRIERAGLRWGIVTNKPGFLTDPLLVALRLGPPRAAVVVSGDTLAQKKPHPLPLLHAAERLGLPPQHCLYVGDAERDIAAARATGMPSLVATFGYIAAGTDWRGWAPDGAIDRFEELLDWLPAHVRGVA